MKRICPALVTCALLLTLGAFAQQNPTRPPAQPSEPPAAQPNQQPQTPPAPQPQAPEQGSRPGSQPPSIDDQVKVLAQELNLSDDQQAKSRTILEDQRQQAATVIGDNTLSRDDKVQKIRALRETTIAKVRGILNDDQKKKLDQMLQEPGQAPPSKEPPK